MSCPNCGVENEFGRSYCWKCGFVLLGNDDHSNDIEAKKKTDDNA